MGISSNLFISAVMEFIWWAIVVPTFLTSHVVSLANCNKKFAISAMYLVTELDLIALQEIAWPVAKNTEYIANM